MDTVDIDRFEPDYTKSCECCGQTPIVNCVKDNTIVFTTTLCGVCTWGEASAVDPNTWNDLSDTK